MEIPIFISNKGNTNGPNIILENTLTYIQKALSKGFFVKVDITRKGYDEDKREPIFILDKTFDIVPRDLLENKKVYFQCSDFDTLYEMTRYNKNSFVYTYQHSAITLNSTILRYFPDMYDQKYIIMFPELAYSNIEFYNLYPDPCGICSDFIESFLIDYYNRMTRKIKEQYPLLLDT